MSTTTTPPDLVPEITTVRVVGHTFRYCVNVPAHPVQAGHGTDRLTVAECGAAVVHRMLATALTGRAIGLRWSAEPGTRARAGWLAPLAAPAAIPGHARHAWDMRWLPIDPDGKKPAEALRIGASRELEWLPGAPADLGGLKWEPLALSPYDPGAGDADAKTAVYACVDASAPPKTPDDLVRGNPGLVLLHLTASRRVARTSDFDDLTPALAGLVRCERLVVVVGDRALNHLGLPVTDDNSWEAFADALMGSKKWKLYDGLRTGFKNAHLIVRHKAYGAVRIDHRGPDVKDRKRYLHYVLDAGHSLPAPSGFLRGHNAVLGASILAHLVARPDPARPFGDALTDGIAVGLRRCMSFEARGFFGAGRADLLAPVGLFDGAVKPEPGFASLPVPSHDAAIRLSRKWSLLDVIVQGGVRPGGEKWREGEYLPHPAPDPDADPDADPPPPPPPDPTAAPVDDLHWARACEIGEYIVLHGLKAAVKKYQFPAVRFGEMEIVDRVAFEQVREIQSAMRNYLGAFKTQNKGPLCLGVFGAPGGGKSGGIKQLAKSLNNPLLDLKTGQLEVNVSQLAGPADLEGVFRRVRDVTLQGNVPLVFFDEFDTPRGGPFGWLQTFLAPMQDGKFGRESGEVEFRHGIFVFIGGVNHTFAMFNGRAREREFIAAKGPDFVSRLSRYFNVLGISREGDGDYTYLIRRAVILRTQLWWYQRAIFPDGEDGPARISPGVAWVLLRVRAFRHGVRSLEAILRTSRLAADQPTFHLGSLPPEWQLDMHLDLAEFKDARDACPLGLR